MSVEISGTEFVILAVIAAIATVASWFVIFLSLSKSPDALKAVIADGFIIRIFTVGFIVATVTLLSLANRLTPEVATIFAGIAGYVLGTGHRRGSNDREEP